MLFLHPLLYYILPHVCCCASTTLTLYLNIVVKLEVMDGCVFCFVLTVRTGTTFILLSLLRFHINFRMVSLVLWEILVIEIGSCLGLDQVDVPLLEMWPYWCIGSAYGETDGILSFTNVLWPPFAEHCGFGFISLTSCLS